MPEALEKWPIAWFEMLQPRLLEIVYEINRRLLDTVRTRFPGDDGRLTRVSLVEEGAQRKIRMANLAIVGSHSTNGVAAVELLPVHAFDDQDCLPGLTNYWGDSPKCSLRCASIETFRPIDLA